MECQLCENEIEAYLQGRLSPELRIQVEDHLKECGSCSQSLFIEKMAANIIAAEKAEQCDTFIADRVMAQIDKQQTGKASVIRVSFLRNFVYATSVAAAVFAGIVAGNFYTLNIGESSIPAEMSYMDDAEIEAINLFADEN